jgi:dTDP-4-dehydrorhamnose reductase
MEKIKVAVLGASGMLGWMVNDVLEKNNELSVDAYARTPSEEQKTFDALRPISQQIHNIPNYIINCIGIIKPYCKDDNQEGVKNAIEVNALFPHRLANYCQENNVKLIQIATDCVYSGEKGNYTENDLHDALDVYGKTKSLGEVQLPSTLHLRCSIIGPEKKHFASLLEWFLAQEGEVKGFTNHYWNGVTTYQFARLCEKIITENHFEELRKNNFVHHVIPKDKVSKYELLQIFSKVYNKKIKITPYETSPGIDRILRSNYTEIGKIIYPVKVNEDVNRMKQYLLGDIK